MQCVSTVSSLCIYRISMMQQARLKASPSKFITVYDFERIRKRQAYFSVFIICQIYNFYVFYSFFIMLAGLMLAALLICLIIVNKEMAVVMATATANKSNVKGALWAKSCK